MAVKTVSLYFCVVFSFKADQVYGKQFDIGPVNPFTSVFPSLPLEIGLLKGTLRRRLSYGYFSFIAKYTSN